MLVETYLPYSIPYQEFNTNNLNLESDWPTLKSKFQTYILLDQLYFTRVYILGSEDPRTLAAKVELERVENELKSAGLPPFTKTEAKQTRIDTVVSETFPFLDPDMPGTYLTESRQANNSATSYTQRMTPSIYQFSSSDRDTRLTAYKALTEVDHNLANEIINIFTLRTDYMNKKSGSVRNFFLEKDGIDWSSIFNNSSSNQLIQAYASYNATKRAESLDVDSYGPHDVFAEASTIGNRKPIDSTNSNKTHDYTATAKKFLLHLGLEEISQKLISVSSKRTGGYLLYVGKNWQPRPLIFYSDSSGRKPGSWKYHRMCAHEAGHAAAHYVSSRASKPLYTLRGIISEFPSLLFENFFTDKEALNLLGFDENVEEAQRYSLRKLYPKLRYSEFEYQLYQLAENGQLTVEGIGGACADVNSKYLGVQYDRSPVDHTWQYLVSRQILHDPWFQMRSYVVGQILASATIEKLKEELGNQWIGTDVFKQRFSKLFEQLFQNGPFTTLSDIEKFLDINAIGFFQCLLRKELDLEKK